MFLYTVEVLKARVKEKASQSCEPRTWMHKGDKLNPGVTSHTKGKTRRRALKCNEGKCRNKGKQFRLQNLGWKQARCCDAHRKINRLFLKTSLKSPKTKKMEMQREMWIFKSKTAKATDDRQQNHKDVKHWETRHIPQIQQERTGITSGLWQIQLWNILGPRLHPAARQFPRGALHTTDFLDLILKDVVDFVWEPTHRLFWEAS